MSSKSLWPTFQITPLEKTPKIILEEQAQLLEKATNGYFITEVITTPVTTSVNRVTHLLRFTAPLVENHVVQVVSLEHEIIKYYPLNVTARIKPMAVLSNASNEEELIIALTRIFSEKETIEIVESLLLQSKANENFSNNRL